MTEQLTIESAATTEPPGHVKRHWHRLNQIKKLRREIERAGTHLERYEAAIARLEHIADIVDPMAEELELVTLEADALRAALVYITTAPTLDKAREVAANALQPNNLEESAAE